MLIYPYVTPRFDPDKWVLHAILQARAEQMPDRPFLQWTDASEPLSFREVDKLTNRIANGLANRGVKKGDLVALFLPNCIEYIFLWISLSKLGAVEVTIGEPFSGNFLRHPIR